MALIDQTSGYVVPCMGWKDRVPTRPDRNRWLWWLIAAGAALALLKGNGKGKTGGQTQ
jgi:hypothetical protein